MKTWIITRFSQCWQKKGLLIEAVENLTSTRYAKLWFRNSEQVSLEEYLLRDLKILKYRDGAKVTIEEEIEKRENKKRDGIQLILYISLLVLISFFIVKFVGQRTVVSGE